MLGAGTHQNERLWESGSVMTGWWALSRKPAAVNGGSTAAPDSVGGGDIAICAFMKRSESSAPDTTASSPGAVGATRGACI